MKIKPPFPARLKEARKNAGLSQKELGIKAGLDEFTASPRMNQYERGTHAPDYLIVKNIADVLNIPTAYFFAEEDELAKIILEFRR
jgi:transcriptional regulator with XRE-family HTH domain